MRHQQDVGSLQGKDPGDFGKLIVVTDDRPDFAETKIVNLDLAPALVVKRLVARQVNLALLTDVPAGADEELSVENNVARLFRNPN